MGIRQPVLANGLMRCRGCGLVLPITTEYFKPTKNTKTGVISRCRACMNKYNADWQDANWEATGARRRELYAIKHANEQKRRAEEWEALAPERRTHEIEMQKAREARRLEQVPMRARASIMRSGMVSRARDRSLPFDAAVFTFEYMLALIEKTTNCPCCGVLLDYGFKRIGPNKKVPGPSNQSPSIDRIVAELGYVVGNIALICWRCNNLKRDASIEELETIVRWMKSHSLTPG